MKNCYTAILSLFIVVKMNAQPTQTGIAGEYYLRGVMETASGFKLNTDSTFDFFFSYGALDRFGKGNWSTKDGDIIFNSKPWPGNDFSLLSSRVLKNDSLVIRINGENPMFISGVYCLVQSQGKTFEQQTDKLGYIKFPKMKIDTVTLIFQFCPERTSVFTITDPKHNYFEFGFSEWIMEVFFKDFILHPVDSMLVGKHPLLEGISYNYKKTR